MSAALLAALLVGGGLALVLVGVLARVREQGDALADILDLPYGERDVAIESVSETRGGMFAPTIALADRMAAQIDAKGSLGLVLERARIPLRPGEYLVLSASIAVVVGALAWAVTEQWLFALLGMAGTVAAAVQAPRWRVARRRKAFQEQLPDALSLIASSLAAGHTFLRAIQMMCEESEPPLSEEFARVVHETQLGGSVVDALDRMAERLEIRDVSWIVQAIRIQQTVGGKLAELLHTLADFMRAREEIRREIGVLTAEGRISAWVLGALPVFLLVAVQVTSPTYMKPMFQGWGLIVLGLTGASVAFGVWLIRRMVRIDV